MVDMRHICANYNLNYLATSTVSQCGNKIHHNSKESCIIIFVSCLSFDYQ